MNCSRCGYFYQDGDDDFNCCSLSVQNLEVVYFQAHEKVPPGHFPRPDYDRTCGSSGVVFYAYAKYQY